MSKVLGCDVALNHSAFVLLNDGELSRYWYVTDIASSAKHPGGTRFPPEILKIRDPDERNMRRLDWWWTYLVGMMKEFRPEIVSVEGYALDAQRDSYAKGELGGLVRLIAYRSGARLRLHEPQSIKMFIAHDGTCQKDAVERSVERRFGKDFGALNPPKPPKAKVQNRKTSEDLCDAYSAAYMGHVEDLLRRGKANLGELHEKEIRVFNRVTKAHPVNLLDREWIKLEK